MVIRRAAIAMMAVGLGLAFDGGAALAAGPVFNVVPSDTVAGGQFTAKYAWVGCGGIQPGDYALDIYFDDTKTPIGSAPFSYPGKGDCVVETTANSPTTASGGAHKVLADIEDLKNNLQPGSSASAAFTVDPSPNDTASGIPAKPTPPIATAVPTTPAPPSSGGSGGVVATPSPGSGGTAIGTPTSAWPVIALLLVVAVGGALIVARRRKGMPNPAPGSGSTSMATRAPTERPTGMMRQMPEPSPPGPGGPRAAVPGAPSVPLVVDPTTGAPMRSLTQGSLIATEGPSEDERRQAVPLCNFSPDTWSVTGSAFQVNPGDSIPGSTVRIHGEPPVRLGGDYWHVPYPRGNKDDYWFGTPFDTWADFGSGPPHDRDQAVGSRTSREFMIDFNYLSFLVAGDHDPARLRVELLVRSASDPIAGTVAGDAIVGPGRASLLAARQATGGDDSGGDDRFHQVVWDVRELRGKRAMVRFVDESPEGHIDVADLACSDTSPDAFHAPVWGFADLHAHPMAGKGFGGGLIAGDYDASSPSVFDLQECDEPGPPFQPHYRDVGDFVVNMWPDGHQAGGRGGVPSFGTWPSFLEGIHQQMHPEWIRRAHAGGLRLMVALVVHSEFMAQQHVVHPELGHSDWAVTERQVRYWNDVCAANADLMAIAQSPGHAREIIESGRLAVVLGLEVDSALAKWKHVDEIYEAASVLGHTQGIPAAGVRDLRFAALVHEVVRQQLHRLWDMGIRQLNPVHLADNAFGNCAVYDEAFNVSQQMMFGTNVVVEAASDVDFRLGEERDGSMYQIASLADGYHALHEQWDHTGVDAAGHPEAGHVNGGPGLTDPGRIAIEEMMRFGLIIDVDHMSRRTGSQVIDMAENLRLTLSDSTVPGQYPLVSAHASFRDLSPRRHWRHEDQPEHGQRAFNHIWPHESEKTAEQLERLRQIGGLVAPITSHVDSLEFSFSAPPSTPVLNNCPGTTKTWAQELMYAFDRMQGAVGLGTDMALLREIGPRFGPLAAYGLTDEELGGARWERHHVVHDQDHGVRYDRPAATLPFFNPPDANAEWKLNPYVVPQDSAVDLGFGDRCAFATSLWDTLSRWAIGDPYPPSRGDAAEVLQGFRAANEADARAISPRALMAFQILNEHPVDGGRDPRSDFVLISDAVRMWRRMAGPNVPLARCGTGRDWDFNTDGLAHYGMLPDMLQDLRNVGLPNPVMGGLFQSAEAYLGVWERCEKAAFAAAAASRVAEEHAVAPGASRGALGGGP